MANPIGLEVRQHGMKQALDRLSPSRMRRALDGALGLASRHLLTVIRAESRVKTGDYRRGWRPLRESHELRSIVNEVEYAEFVTGARQRTTLGGPKGKKRRRGSGDYFMRHIMREQRPVVRQIIRERIIREFR